MDPQNTEAQNVNVPPIPSAATPVPATAPVPVAPQIPNQIGVQEKQQDVEPQQNDVAGQEEEKKPIYKEWTFWLLINLILILGVMSYVVFGSLLQSPLTANISVGDELIRVHVLRLVAPTEGFLAVQENVNGLPGNVIGYTKRSILPATYTDIYVPFEYDEKRTYAYYLNLIASGNVFLTFYKDTDGNHDYDQFTDTVIPTDILGRRMQISVAKATK